MSSKIIFEERNTAFSQRLLTFAIKNVEHIDIREFLSDSYHFYNSKISELIDSYGILKVAICFSADFEKIVMTEDGEKKEKQTLYVHSQSEIVDLDTELSEYYQETVVNFILQKIDEAIFRGSSFSLSTINELIVEVNKFDPIKGSSYIKLSKELEAKKAIINVKNDDDYCFKWAILSKLHAVKNNASRVASYAQYSQELNFTGLKFPIAIHDIKKFEQLNPAISVNVYTYDDKNEKINPIRLTKKNSTEANHINLLLLTEIIEDNKAEEIDPENRNATVKSHYCWIKNLGRLITRQVTKHKGKCYFCDRCLNHFTTTVKLEKHRTACFIQNDYQIEMPTEDDNEIKFKNFKKNLKVPFIIYADIETLLTEPTEQFSKSEKTKAYHKHEVYSIGYFLHCNFDETRSHYKSNRSERSVDWFVEELQKIAIHVAPLLCKVKPMNLTPQQEVSFLKSYRCHICGEFYGSYSDDRVRDHSHLTGEYRGSAHSKCNLAYQESRVIPIVFHNLSRYDAHFIIRKLASGFDGDISVIPVNAENYISFSKVVNNSGKKFHEKIRFQFIDSFRFMSASLDYLSSLLPANKKTISNYENRKYTLEQRQLIQRKGILPYEYLDSFDKLSETKLPPKEAFYSRLNNQHISDEEFAQAKEIWEKFNVKTIGEYTDIYLKTDVILLADVFENFRETCSQIYDLDPAHYISAPSLSFDAMLKYTKVRIELLTDIDQLLFIERGIRGGISQCSKRYVKANNPYMEDYDPEEIASFLVYLDANNLYGYSMMQPLPLNDFQWSKKVFTAEKIMQIPDDSHIGYIFEVDLDYPISLHSAHNDYPFCAENMCPPGGKQRKLLLTLDDKRNYVIHYKMLKIALQHNLKLRKIHRVLQFHQSTFLKPYIELNTAMRTKATNEFDKNFYKLLSNAIYGKTMENLRSRADVKLKTYWSGRYGAASMIANPSFKRRTIFDEDLVAIEMNKTSVLMNKPIAIGMAILDISKTVMYDFHYNFMKPKYGINAEVVYTDTDSFIYEIKRFNFYAGLLENLEKFDTSDYPINNQFNIPQVNKKVPGLFKDEMNSEIITEFVGLRSKMYSVRSGRVDKMKKAKGVKKNVLNREIEFDDYMYCLYNHTTIVRNQSTFRSKLHDVYTIEQNKVALSPFDDKRYILKNGVDTMAWGNVRIPQRLELIV